jgi:hypothetical protein
VSGSVSATNQWQRFAVVDGNSLPPAVRSGKNLPLNNAPAAKFAAPAQPSQANPAPQATDATDDSQFESALAQALRADGASASGSSSDAPEAGDGQRSVGIALYKTINQIGNDEPSASDLLKSWNSIMQSGQDADDQGAAVMQALLRSGATPYRSDILDVTA